MGLEFHKPMVIDIESRLKRSWSSIFIQISCNHHHHHHYHHHHHHSVKHIPPTPSPTQEHPLHLTVYNMSPTNPCWKCWSLVVRGYIWIHLTLLHLLTSVFHDLLTGWLPRIFGANRGPANRRVGENATWHKPMATMKAPKIMVRSKPYPQTRNWEHVDFGWKSHENSNKMIKVVPLLHYPSLKHVPVLNKNMWLQVLGNLENWCLEY